MKKIVGKIKIGPWPEWKPVEIERVNQLLQIRIWINELGRHRGENSHLNQACEALDRRNVYYREVTRPHGVFLHIPTFKYGDWIDHLQYALGMTILFQEDPLISPMGEPSRERD